MAKTIGDESATLQRMATLEAAVRLLETAIFDVVAGVAAMSARQQNEGVTTRALTIVNEAGRAVVCLTAGADGHGLAMLADQAGVATAVITSDEDGGCIGLLDHDKGCRVRIGVSDANDGQLHLIGRGGALHTFGPKSPTVPAATRG